MCGENLQSRISDAVTSGSSPRVRGKLSYGGQEDERQRLIPACAGKTRQPCGSGLVVAAHPRVCGENMFLPKGMYIDEGSSPRVRGKHGLVLCW